MDSRSGDGVHGGDFGSTARTSIQVTDRNGDVFGAQVYRCVNVTTDPELRDALASGAIFEVEAPDSADTFRLALPVQYHDEELELFALVIPDELRHREFALRQDLLAQLAHAGGDVPAYVREFHTVCGVDALRQLEQKRVSGDDAPPRAMAEDLVADGGAPQPVDQQAELDKAWRDVEAEREQLERDREQLDDVASRINRERTRMDEVEEELAQERKSLSEMRSEIEAMKLNLEQERMRLEQGVPASNAEESTQVVTDDQFIEVVEGDEISEAEVFDDGEDEGEDGGEDKGEREDAHRPDEAPDVEPGASPTEATELIESPYADHGRRDEALTEVRIERVDQAGVPASFDDVGPGDRARHVAVVDGRVVACAKLSETILAAVEQSEDLSFFVQLASDTDYPHVGLLLAALDDEQQPEVSVGWPIDVVNADHEIVLDRLEGAVELLAALYDDDGELAAVYDICAPLQQNLGWIRQDVERRLTDSNPEGGSFEEVAAEWADDDNQRLGSMRHNFQADSFEEATSPAELKLACGIVGYWSAPDKFAYLVSNRSFPLDQFEAIQARVIRRAVQHGLFLNADLRRVAVEMGLAADSVELVERLLSEFAELSVGLRDNDLDPIEEWENWDALVELAEDLGVTPDPDVLELAEASLKRAQDFQETDLGAEAEPTGLDDAATDGLSDAESANADGPDGAPDQGAPTGEDGPDDAIDEYEVDDLVVARRSETTGVTYFLPDDAVLDTFDDLASMPREDLEMLLDDAKGRLEAAQMIIERFGSEGVQVALDGAEKMMTSEVAALARFVETKAEGLEAELVRCVESGGPSATYVAGQALASIRSTPAIPTLLKAFRDDRRRGNKEQLARAIAVYGEKLLPPLKRAIKKDGHDDAIVMLLRELERQHDGLLGELAKDRSKNVRNAASAARSN